MKSLSIPVRVIGPGSQPEEEPLQYLDMPHEMDTFRMPLVPERTDAEALSEARDVLQEFLEALEPWDPLLASPAPMLALTGLSPAARVIVNQMLGDGEVSIKLDGERRAHIQESVFAGVWRVCELDADDRLIGDWIEAGAILFPLTPEDHRVLEKALPVGPVAIISRGFGNCRITSTLARNVWRVQYFNTMNTLILNTLEIVEAPEVALAAPEDIEDSRERLSELIEWMSESCTA